MSLPADHTNGTQPKPIPPRLNVVAKRPQTLRRRRTMMRRELIQTPPVLRRLARWTIFAMPVFLFFAGFLPWQQSAVGSGEVVAFSPDQRVQAVQAPISGRIISWEVSEGSVVRKGDLLLRLGDNDPERVPRLQRQLANLGEERVAATAQVASKDRGVVAKRASREQIDAEYNAKIAELRRKALGEKATLDTANLNLDRIQLLQAEGIASNRDLELALLSVAKQQATVEALDLEIVATQRAREKALASTDAEIAISEAERDETLVKIASINGKYNALEGKLAYQQSQDILAPRDGVVLSLKGAPIGGQVKAGDDLIQLVPETDAGAVAIYADGRDLPWIEVGDQVRVVFEGIPALQWVGPPGDGIGTYPGRVALIDATRSSSGKFRVVVVPVQGDRPWPVLRQGVKAKGFVLLGEVRLGWEVWRRINSFPPDTPTLGGKPASSKKPRDPGLMK
ncbi:MAG: adhesin transport system membrane fusion protein [Cognaticolwellia sp.]|jgi:adhesin transport system membrane fusion protein